MASRFVRPDLTVLKISDGDTLTVKRRLSSGEQRAMFARMSHATTEGGMRVDPLQVSLGMMVAYLIDWSLKDDDGTVVAIRGLSPDELVKILDDLEPDAFAEIREAIEKHDAAMRAEREAEKNGQGGGKASPAISPSPTDAAGATNGSETSIPTSATSSLIS